MIMKRLCLLFLIVCLLAGCASPQQSGNASLADNTVDSTTVDTVPTEHTRYIFSFPDTTMENLTDTILPVSLEKGGVYADETGQLHMELKIYTYDLYDMVDISSLKVGDTIVRHTGDVKIASLDRNEHGVIFINGGLDNGGFELVTDESGIYFEAGFNDHMNWYEAGSAILPVSDDFVLTDSADLDAGEVTYSADSFLNGEVTNYDFTPYNTTVRVAGGQIVEMNRRYIP